MKKLIIALLAIVFIAFSTNITNAQNRKGKNFKGKKIFEELNLSDAQKEEFRKLKLNEEEKTIDIKAELSKNRLAVKKLFTEKNLNQSAIMNLIDKGSELRNQLHKLKVKTWFNINNILNDKQKEVWKEHFSGIGKNFEQHPRKLNRGNKYRGR